MKELFVILVSFINTDLDSDIIHYKKVTWNDYETVKTAKNSTALAISNVGIHYYWNGDKTIDVNFVFKTSKSWVLEGNKTKDILNHEQRHLDLAYLYALKLVKEFRDCQPQSDKEAEQVYWRVEKELYSIQEEYDLDTQISHEYYHPGWGRKIDSLITLYKPYSLPLKKKSGN